MTDTLKHTPKRTPEEKNFSEPIQWLLEFVNLPFKPGIPSVFRPQIRPLKRTPTKEPTPLKPISEKTLEDVKAYYEKKGFARDAINESIEYLKRNRGIVDDKGYAWDTKGGKPVFAGYGSCYPTLAELNTFLKEHGLPQVSNDVDFWDTREFGLWNKAFHVFAWLARLNSGNKITEYEGSKHIASGFCNEYTKNFGYTGNAIMHNKTLSGVITGYMYSFWEKHKDLHSRVLQCQCCGRFWIKNNKQDSFCDTVCNNVFNKQSRIGNVKSVVASKRIKRTREKKNDYNAIMNFYINVGYPKGSAEEHAHKWVYEDNKTFKNFKRHELKHNDNG